MSPERAVPSLLVGESPAGLAVAVVIVGRPIGETGADYCFAEVHLVIEGESPEYTFKSFVFDHVDVDDPEGMLREYAMYRLRHDLGSHLEKWRKREPGAAFPPAYELKPVADHGTALLWLRDLLGESIPNTMRRNTRCENLRRLLRSVAVLGVVKEGAGMWDVEI